MYREFKGKYINGKVELLEETDLEEGQEVLVHIPLLRKFNRSDKPLSVESDTEEKGYKSFSEMPSSWKTDPEYWEGYLRTIYKNGRRCNFMEND